MPVENHEVHDSVKIKADEPYGCWGRIGMAAGYFAPDRALEETVEFSLQARFIPHVMSTDCRYDLWETDPRCTGCTTQKDHAYADKMRGLE